MKKIIFFLMMFLTLSICSSCNFFNNKNSNGEDEKSNLLNLKIIDDNFSKDIQINSKELCTIEYNIKPNFYLKGYYDNEIGGIKYFNSIGQLESVWQDNFPTTLYAQWGRLSELRYQDNGFSEDAVTLEYYSKMTWTLTPEWINAAKGNLNRSIKVKISFRCKHSNSIITSNRLMFEIVDKFGQASECFSKKIFQEITNSYKTYEFECEIPAKAITDGFFRNYVTTYCSGAISIKDMYVTMEFTEN